MRHAIVTGTALVLLCSTLATPAGASTVPARRPSPRPTASPAHRLSSTALYSSRSRRLIRAYLRLKILEMREADLERARKVIERKLGIGTLLSETPPPYAR